MTSESISSHISIHPCVKCGATNRNASGNCRPCQKANTAAWQAANPEKRKAHDAKSYLKNADHVKACSAAWRAKNPDKVKAYTAEHSERSKANNVVWLANNPEKSKARTTAWRAANPERTKATTAAWAKANPERRRISAQNRRARRIASGGTLSNGLSAKLLKLQKGKCACCKQPLGNDYHLDHIMPIALGGSNTDDNIQLLRAICNLKKSATHPINFMQSRGFLL